MTTPSSPRKSDLVLSFVQGSPSFAALSDEQKGELSENSNFVRLAEKQTIFKSGDPAAGGYVVATGMVVLKRETFKGKFIVTELLHEHDPFGAVTAARGLPYPLTAETLRESVLLHISQEYLEKAAHDDIEFSNFLLKVCGGRLKNCQNTVANLADANSKVRIASALLLFWEKAHLNGGENHHLSVTREEISSLAGTTVETCIRATRSFEDDGILELPASRQIKLLRPEKLRELCVFQSPPNT